MTNLEKTSHINVIKASGEKQVFSLDKLRTSLKRAGAPPQVIDDIVSELQSTLYEGITTKKLYSRAHRLLRKRSKSGASRYQLKKAIMQLGPSGFPFEKFVARLLAEEGFATSTSLFLQGKCVQHEVDVMGRSENEILLAECKYHNRGGIAVDVKVPLYVQARFADLAAGNGFDGKSPTIKGFVVTNARFTSDAIAYGTCAGLQMLSWDFPARTSLRDRIDSTGLYPLTCLGTLTRHEKEALLGEGLVLARDITNEVKKVQHILGAQKYEKLAEEVRHLCAGLKTEDDRYGARARDKVT